ncbi:MAG: hypothetical protein ACQES1_07875 [Bacteroidota bacterium]
MKEKQKICKRCVMPESPPYIYLNEDGICNLCVAYDLSGNTENKKPLESDLIKILSKNKRKGKYDCMVMCSGGKDSTSALYYMKKRYKLTPLAFTFDHGFEPDDAMENIKKATDVLNVDFMLYKSMYMADMFRKIITSGSPTVLCHPCSIWYMDLAYDIAERFDIPLIVAGWTSGQSSNDAIETKSGCGQHNPEFRQMSEDTEAFLKTGIDIPKYKNFPKSMQAVIKKHKKRKRAQVISPHWFLPYGPEDYVPLIQKELDWHYPKHSYPKGSTNCSLNFLSVYYSMKHYGYTHYHVEASKLIRQGQLLREEAIEQLKINFDEETLQEESKKLGINFSEYK